ncbi:endonuclease/exonuclease/phosphatase family protein [Nitratifractor sp.]
MFKRPKLIHCPESSAPNPHLSRHFGLLCWNVNKRRRSGPYRRLFERWRQEWNLELLCLQEARLRREAPFLLEGFACYAAANLRIAQRYYGVLNASASRPLDSQAFLSEGREGFFGPRKSFLLQRHRLASGATLLLLNVHGINFRENGQYDRELERMRKLLMHHKGPMIVTGDFNGWNPGRQRRLKRFSELLGLEHLDLPVGGVKHFLGHPLDLIFYRALDPRRFDVPFLSDLSDHNPILVEFTETD